MQLRAAPHPAITSRLPEILLRHLRAIPKGFILMIGSMCCLGCFSSSPSSSTHADPAPVALPDTCYKVMEGIIDGQMVSMSFLKTGEAVSGYVRYLDGPGRATDILDGSIDSLGRTSFITDFDTVLQGRFYTERTWMGKCMNANGEWSGWATLYQPLSGSADLSIHIWSEEDHHLPFVPITSSLGFDTYEDTLWSSIFLKRICVSLPDAAVAARIQSVIDSALFSPQGVAEEGDLARLPELARDSMYHAGGVCDVYMNAHGILSMEVTIWRSTRSNPDENLHSHCLNFDLKTGALIQAKEVFLPGFEGRLDAMGTRRFTMKHPDGGHPSGFHMPEEFTILQRGIRWGREHKSSSMESWCGPMYIPYKDLSAILRKDGVLREVLR